MNDQFQAAMREATRLTQAGRLIEATALIQRTLQGAGAAAPSDTPQAPLAADIYRGRIPYHRADASDSCSTCAP